jgi:hypothetical protein
MDELEAKYLSYLKRLYAVIDVKYKSVAIEYQDMFTGEKLIYFPSFTVNRLYYIEHVEVKPASKHKPLTQYLYAQNKLPFWRMITKEELINIGCDDFDVPNWW